MGDYLPTLAFSFLIEAQFLAVVVLMSRHSGEDGGFVEKINPDAARKPDAAESAAAGQCHSPKAAGAVHIA